MDVSRGGSRFCCCTVFLIVVYFSLQELFAFCSIEECLGTVRSSNSNASNETSLADALPVMGELGWCEQETSDSADEVPLKLINEIQGYQKTAVCCS